MEQLFTSNAIKSIALNKTGSKGKPVEMQAEVLKFAFNSEIYEFRNSLNLECTPVINSTLHMQTRAHSKALFLNTLLIN